MPVEEIIASLFEAVVHQNLATLTKGNTPAPKVLLLGGPNLFFNGLQQAWRHHLTSLWTERKVVLPDEDPHALIQVPAEAVYYASLGCIEIGKAEAQARHLTTAARNGCAGGSRRVSTSRRRSEGRRGLISGDAGARRSSWKSYGDPEAPRFRRNR